ncbi:exported hypothetical protein [Kamptonema sp. PCC 6506]|nr:exported hypothetical protein [Kamptonema sp. PCC 6506]
MANYPSPLSPLLSLPLSLATDAPYEYYYEYCKFYEKANQNVGNFKRNRRKSKSLRSCT